MPTTGQTCQDGFSTGDIDREIMGPCRPSTRTECLKVRLDMVIHELVFNTARPDSGNAA